MIQKLKNALDNSFLWLLFFVGCIAYFWKKEKDLEYELQEMKSNDEIKSAKDEVAKADSVATDSAANYESVRKDYLRNNKDGA